MNIQDYPITTPFRAVDAWHSVPHKGVDYALPFGARIPAINDGRITAVTDEGARSFGRAVYIHLRDGYDVIYGHLSRVKVHTGDYVHRGQTVAYSGNSGDSTGPHLHLQVMYNGLTVDPERYMNENLAPWWDLSSHATGSIDTFKAYWESGLLNWPETLLPSVAALGMIWWMFPFAPKPSRGLALCGFSLVVYLFYVLLKGAYLYGG